MSDRPVNLSSGLPNTVLPDDPTSDAISELAGLPADVQRRRLEELVAATPRSSFLWAALGDRATNPIESYAYYRVGYHRGLDALRANGWRGSGYVRWRHVGNRGFLRSLAGLARTAGAIGETDEAERCSLFLLQSDPEWNETNLQ